MRRGRPNPSPISSSPLPLWTSRAHSIHREVPAHTPVRIRLKRSPPNAADRPVRASDLAQMGVCERLVYFENRYGRRATNAQDAAARRGNAAHEEFLRDARRCEPGLRTSGAKPWCWIASAVYGPTAGETMVLRAFRDLVLRQSSSGRAAIALYYRSAPPIARALARSSAARSLARAILAPVVAVADRLVRKQALLRTRHG